MFFVPVRSARKANSTSISSLTHEFRMSIKNINIGYIGDSSAIHYSTITELFKNVNKNVYFFHKSYANSLEKQKNTLIKGHTIISKYLVEANKFIYKCYGVINSEYNKTLLEFFDKTGVDCILSYWGTNTIPDIISIKRIRPEIKIIHTVLCHPMGLTPLKIFLQNIYFRKSVKYIDGIIYNSNIMKSYFEKNVLYGKKLPSIIIPPYFTKRYFPDKRLVSCNTIPNLVFLGRMDWWAAQPTDNVLGELNALLASGIHVYHSNKTGDLPHCKNRHIFSPMNILELMNYTTQFDASLIIYNMSACKKDDRFKITIPDRLISSVNAGIPIAIPKNGYDACKEYLYDYKAVIEFSSPEDLKAQLSDRTMVTEYRNIAIENSSKYYAEDRFSIYLNFLRKIIDLK